MNKVILFLIVMVPSLLMAADKTLYIYNWTEYMPDQVLEEFTKETGIKVKYATFESNESMYTKVKLLNGSGYDLVFPSTYFVHRMRKDGLLSPIDKTKLSNIDHLDESLMNKPYDPDNKYSIPYLWGSTAIGLNSEFVKPESITSWKDLWKPEFKNRTLLTDDLREVFGLGLKLKGYSVNDTDPAHIKEAYELLVELLPNIRLFASDSPKQPFLNQEVYIGMIWNGEVYMAAEEMPEIKYIYPKEGAIFWADSMVIPKHSENKENAHTFINFILRPEIAKLISEEIGYASPNKTAVSMLSPDLKNNQTVYPVKADLEKGEFQTDVGDAILILEEYWNG
jgi:spermidine/putrescine transport system substrate-binding protein